MTAAEIRDESQEKEMPAGSQSLLRGLMLLEILSNYPNGCPLAQLSTLAELNKSTVHRLLQGLQACGYVTPAPAAGSYRLTTKLVAIGQKALSSLNILHVAAPHLEALNLRCSETVNFSSREDDHAILIYKLEPTTGMLRTRAYIGQRMPLYCSAMGKIFLAYGQPDYLSAYWRGHRKQIQALTCNTITQLPVMQQELAQVRAEGVALDREENELGVSCIAVPVFDIRQRVTYSVSVSLSSARLAQIGLETLLPPLRATAGAISAELGCNG
ncbi:IclR family transcriptional regulator [Edwardsiella anguillarum]|uniref:IclR family transcriptional regulator n=1 Tax=Edwardsiella anguillarum TaxID=1821960 RepID=UPI0024B668C4|nr:IclR family transcriptional regulator [Edwardsiella anguillarum]WHP79871.1 IclR family transcriptional regulator [Edwardsiella anguillarum]WHQ17332.1 IclR family transcriptional regulator [Edwardsiella anguillarum]WHQ20869.1 IclR family transcriptional regulator [Edwardsiella anguillarum]WHQ24391.1 IclR family transcriptional regulator [Edwardsiella anguillarum]WHQ27960.1 IclR family transcriptional regulator [Edwardsiella anguillarum]